MDGEIQIGRILEPCDEPPIDGELRLIVLCYPRASGGRFVKCTVATWSDRYGGWETDYRIHPPDRVPVSYRLPDFARLLKLEGSHGTKSV